MNDRRSGRRNPAHKNGPERKPGSKKTKSEKGGPPRRKRGKTENIPTGSRSIPESLRRLQPGQKGAITYVLDTNVLMTAWDALFAFEEHDVCILSQVWKELDAHKKGKSDVAWNTRKATREIDALVAGKSAEQLRMGIPLKAPKGHKGPKKPTGKLVFNFTQPKVPDELDIDLDLNEPDDRIILICLAMKEQGKRVVLVSNDGNARVKASVVGIEAEEYLSEAVAAVVSEEDLRPGFHKMPADLWEKLDGELNVERDGPVSRYTLKHPSFKNVYPNEFLLFQDGLELMVVAKPKPQTIVAETFPSKSNQKKVGIEARNVEQELALQLLLDPRIPAVSLAGLAGSGKTFLAIAAGLYQVLDSGNFNRIIITRATIGSDEDIGFLPGDEEEKMSPWMGALYDNLELLTGNRDHSERDNGHSTDDMKAMTDAYLKGRVQVKSLRFMKGRTFNKTFLIIDETQDLTVKKLKMIATRVGPDSKIVFLGNVAQIDDNYLTEHTNGLSVFIRTFADSKNAGHITLQRGERSPFATEAENRL